MIRVCGHKGDVERAEALLRLMQVDGYELTVETYNMVVNACTQSGDIQRAQWYVEQMQSLGLEPDMVTFNSLLNGLAAAGDLKGVEECFRRMYGVGVEPNCITFGTICKAFARVGEVEKVECIMKALDAKGQPLNEYFFASLIAACGASKPPRADKAEQAFKELIRRGLRPGSVKSALVRAVGKRRAMVLIGHATPERNWPTPAHAQHGAAAVAVPPGLVSNELPQGPVLVDSPVNDEWPAMAWRVDEEVRTQQCGQLRAGEKSHSKDQAILAKPGGAPSYCARLGGGLGNEPLRVASPSALRQGQPYVPGAVLRTVMASGRI